MLDTRLTHVVAVGQRGSFTAAAAAVGVTQSAITKSIADLEREVGFNIFHRTARGAILTEQGRDFVDRASRLLEDARSLLRGLRGPEDSFAGVLRIGVCPASLEWRLADPLATLIARHPSVRLDVSGSSFERMVQQLRSGSVDVALGYEAAFADWPDLHRESIPPLRAKLFVRKEHPILDRDILEPSDIADFDVVTPSDSRPYGSRIRQIYESQGVEWQKRLHIVDYFPIVKRLVLKSNSVGVVTDAYTRSPAFQRSFVALDSLDFFPPSPLCCAFRARTEPTPAARALISELRIAAQQIQHDITE